MGDERLPEYVEEALEREERHSFSVDERARVPLGWTTDMPLHDSLRFTDIRTAIHRYAREREAAALEMAASLLERMNREHAPGDPEEAYAIGRFTRAIGDVRSMIQKEPANG